MDTDFIFLEIIGAIGIFVSFASYFHIKSTTKNQTIDESQKKPKVFLTKIAIIICFTIIILNNITSPIVGIIYLFGIIIMIGSLIYYYTIKNKVNKNTNLDEKQKKRKLNFSKIVMIICIIMAISIICIDMYIYIDIVNDVVNAKPIIYLYPEQEEKVTVKVGKEENLTCTYPKYTDKWEVIAKPNGDLTDVKTERNLYALYWEGIRTKKPKIEKGFCVKGEDTVKFLEEKLKVLGLTDREADEFIIYWLPKLEDNKYNLIKFENMEEINENMPLEITPKPDTIIRVMMVYKPVDKYVDIEEQELSTPERKGFTVVEWGRIRNK